MAQRAPADVTAEIVARIVAEVRPWRVVLFGSRARGDAEQRSDWDVYVEVDAPREELKALDRRVARVFAGSSWRADTTIRQAGEVERRRDDPGTLEWDVAREGRVLYADPAAPRTIAPSRRVAEIPREPPESMYEWLAAAERDLRHCRDLWATGSDYAPEICWLSHQTCEKHLKALLVARRVRPMRTHDLSAPLATLRDGGCPLADLDADCALLAEHAIRSRYPAGLDLGVDDARDAFAAAERVIAAVRAALPPHIH